VIVLNPNPNAGLNALTLANRNLLALTMADEAFSINPQLPRKTLHGIIVVGAAAGFHRIRKQTLRSR